jgi:hypothetical protein
MLPARSFSGNEMLLTVENLGPLKQASIDLSREFIVLAGPNNTGKTYMAWTAFGLHRQRQDSLVELVSGLVEPIVDDMLAHDADEFDITSFMRDHGQQFGEILSRAYMERLPGDFGVESNHFRDTRLALRSDAFTPAGQSFIWGHILGVFIERRATRYGSSCSSHRSERARGKFIDA